MAFTWQAHYSDGSQLSQATGAKYQDIDRTRLIAFDLWDGERLIIRVDLRPDNLPPRRLIWRIRNSISTVGGQEAIHLVGWQRTVEGHNVQSISYVFEDGVVLMGGQFQEQDEFMYPVVTLDCEKV